MEMVLDLLVVHLTMVVLVYTAALSALVLCQLEASIIVNNMNLYLHQDIIQ